MANESKGRGRKRVWILGAGFSRPLGGPLLSDLFSMRMWRKGLETFPSAFSTESTTDSEVAMLCVYLIYAWGRDFPDGTVFGSRPLHQGEDMFSDAETFMVGLERKSSETLGKYLDTALQSQAAQNSTGKFIYANKVLDTIATRRPAGELSKVLVQAAKRLMAFECSAFHQELIEAEQDDEAITEPYLPYQAWGKTLEPERDVLITFNYDLVVEEVVKPPEGVPLFHLHGSISDAALHGGVTVKALQPYLHLLEQGVTPDIKVPGRSKSRMSQADKALWDKAGQSIQEADQVKFIGYGLPESDAFARGFILDNLHKNQRRRLSIEVVLGQPSFRTQRLEATIAQTLAHRVPVKTFISQDKNTDLMKLKLLKERNAGGDISDLVQGLDEIRNVEKSQVAPQLLLKILPQYAQDYMQAFATASRA